MLALFSFPDISRKDGESGTGHFKFVAQESIISMWIHINVTQTCNTKLLILQSDWTCPYAGALHNGPLVLYNKSGNTRLCLCMVKGMCCLLSPLQLANTEEFIDGELAGNLGEVLIRQANAYIHSFISNVPRFLGMHEVNLYSGCMV